MEQEINTLCVQYWVARVQEAPFCSTGLFSYLKALLYQVEFKIYETK